MQANDPSQNPGPVHVRGSSAYNRRASPSQKAAAGVIDLALALSAFFLLHRALGLSPVPQLSWLAGGLAVAAALWLGQKLAFGRTLGQACWGLKAEGTGIRARLASPEKADAGDWLRSLGATLAAVALSAWAAGDAVFRQPVWATAEELALEPFLPDMASGEWEVLPFYYTLGAWPRAYGGRPVFHSLPYEKGPPTRFPGHIVARWEDPSTRVTFEGPKTPRSPIAPEPGMRTPRERIRHCLTGAERSWSCLRIREATLLRHLQDIQARLTGSTGSSGALRMKWALKWFTVKNPALPAAEQAQGIYLSARAENRAEERYVLITESGTHQAISLEYPAPDPLEPETSSASRSAALARRTFSSAIRSLRASDELAPGRAWIDRQLQAVQLRDLDPRAKAAGAGIPVARIAQAQAALLAKISVDPGAYDAYFHLGGTALVLQRYARQAGPGALDVTATARPLVASAYRYAQDLAPKDPRTTQLQGFWLESQKP